jgi:uncharacterized membrane protein YfhO
MGFSYDYYVTRSEYDKVPQDTRSQFLLKAIVIPDEDASKYSGILQHYNYSTYSDTNEEYYQNCEDRRSMACSQFSHDNGGFSAQITTDKERLVFFSVPWESGWSAQVNGSTVPIQKVNVGFMAVKVPAGTSQIRFDYQTPGLKLGALITAGGIVLFLLYGYLTRNIDPEPPKRKKYRLKNG